MRRTQDITERLNALKMRHAARDKRHADVMAIRGGDYDRLAGDLLPEGFEKPLVANLIDTAARDMSEVMAPMPSASCATVSAQTQTAKDFAEKRGRIVNSHIQRSRLQEQRYGGADRYGTFGFMTYIVDPDFIDKAPVIRVGTTQNAYYVRDGRGRVREYIESSMVPLSDLCFQFPDYRAQIENVYPQGQTDCELVCYYDDHERVAYLPECDLELLRVPNLISRCPVSIVERPSITGTQQGQFDDVIWVQIARAMVQAYTMSALEQSVNAPTVVPSDVNELELGPLSVLQTDNPAGVGRVRLDIPQGVWPAAETLVNEQRTGSRYPEGRSGSIDASIITGQGVQALMGTFDTQIQTFQRLDTLALEDALSMCLEMEEAVWPNVQKTTRIKDAGSPYEVKYTPAKDIAGDYTVDVSYGAIAGLDPNRGLVFILQALAAGLISIDTARRYLPVELNASAEEERIVVEAIRQSMTASISMLPQAIPMLATQGQDPREIVLQTGEVLDLVQKGKTIEEAVEKVFAPKQKAQPETPVEQLTAPATPGAPQTPGQDLLMSLAGMTPGGDPNLQSNVSRRQPI